MGALVMMRARNKPPGHNGEQPSEEDEVIKRQAARIYSDLPVDTADARRVLDEVDRLLGDKKRVKRA